MPSPLDLRSFAVLMSIALAAGSAMAQPADNDARQKGHQVFMQARCYACHGEFGNGTVGPQLRENPFIGLSDYVVGQILLGRGVMPSFAEVLNNQQIADLATYIRTSWGNKFGAVDASEVAKVRQEVKLNPPQNRPNLTPGANEPRGPAVPPQSTAPAARMPPPGQSQ